MLRWRTRFGRGQQRQLPRRRSYLAKRRVAGCDRHSRIASRSKGVARSYQDIRRPGIVVTRRRFFRRRRMGEYRQPMGSNAGHQCEGESSFGGRSRAGAARTGSDGQHCVDEFRERCLWQSAERAYDISKAAVNHLIRDIRGFRLRAESSRERNQPSDVVKGSTNVPRDRGDRVAHEVQTLAFENAATDEELRGLLAEFFDASVR